MSANDPSQTCHSRSWRSSARRLLRNLTASPSATPTETELHDLHVIVQQYESDRLFGLHNIEIIRRFILCPKYEVNTHLSLMILGCPSSDSIEYHTRYTSSLLTRFIGNLSGHTTRYSPDTRGFIHMKYDTYSKGAYLDMHLAIPDTNGSICQYIAVVKRQRGRPDSLPTGLELYSLLSLAAMFRKQNTHTDVVKVRLFIVYSCWVQVLSATAPLSYILSFVAGKDYLEGTLEVSESPWFNLLSLPDLERLLLFAFEYTTLTEHIRIPEKMLKFFQTQQPHSPTRDMDDLGGGVAKKRKTLHP